tara:strand:+ start:161 stop:619 length:459 start_codon:yes stop_codon:yes gene_type:complete
VKKLFLKKLNLEHKKILYKWYNLKSVLKNSTKGKKFSFKDHSAWFSKQLLSENIIKVIYMDNIPIGVIRLEKQNFTFLLSYMISPKFRRKGFALNAIHKFLKNFKSKKVKKIVAIVKKDNIPSIKIFTKLKFNKINYRKNKNILKFEYRLAK